MTQDDPSPKAKPAAASRRRPARKVAADRIETDPTPSAGGDLPDASLAEPALILPVSEPRPRASIGAGFAAFAIVLLIGGSVALLLTREPRYPKIEAAQPNPAVAAPALSAPVPAAAAPAAPKSDTPPVADDVPAQVVQTAKAAPPPVVSAPTPPVDQRRSANLQAARVAPPQAALADVCDSLPPAGRARCIDDPLDDADARLADAFDNAVDAGVPWPLLRRYRAAWDDLRGRSANDPVRVAAVYGAMAEELDDLASRRFARQ